MIHYLNIKIFDFIFFQFTPNSCFIFKMAKNQLFECMLNSLSEGLVMFTMRLYYFNIMYTTENKDEHSKYTVRSESNNALSNSG